MIKTCGYCKYCYSADTSDVSGFDCRKRPILKITDLDNRHSLCPGFKTNIMVLLWRWFNA